MACVSGTRAFGTLALALTCATAHVSAQGLPPATFTLSDAIAAARGPSPAAEAARARVDAARRAVDVGVGLPNPIVEISAENWASGAREPGLPIDAFATVTQTIELGGKRAARRGIAIAGLGTAEAERATAEFELIRDVAALYTDAVRFREHQRRLAAQASGLSELVRIVERRVAVGSAAESDLFKLLTEQARTASDLDRAELAAVRALLHVNARLDTSASTDALVLPAIPAVVVEIDERAAIARRPDVVSARRTLELARQRSRAEDAQAIPNLAVQAGLKRTAGFETGVLGVAIPIPIFDRHRAARAVARGAVAAAEWELASVERHARGDLAATRVAADRLTRRAREIRTRLVEPAEAARDAARSAFQSGALDVLRLLDAERAAADAALVAIDLEVDAVVAAIDARLAAGEDPLP